MAKYLATCATESAQPLFTTYRGHRVATNPPPGGGLMIVMMLNILEQFDLAAMGHNSPDYIAVVSEAMKIATVDKDTRIGDPRFVDVPLAELCSKSYAARMADPTQRPILIRHLEHHEPEPIEGAGVEHRIESVEHSRRRRRLQQTVVEKRAEEALHRSETRLAAIREAEMIMEKDPPTAALVLLVAFLIIESRVAAPLMPLSLFKLRSVSAANVIAVLWAAGMFAWFFISALYMQLVLGYTPMSVGLAFLPASSVKRELRARRLVPGLRVSVTLARCRGCLMWPRAFARGVGRRGLRRRSRPRWRSPWRRP